MLVDFNRVSFFFSPLKSTLVQVDLEHNQYRSFQGITCLMQVSTRTEDFVIDTLKLRIHIGPYLREIFKDPTKRKVKSLFLSIDAFYEDVTILCFTRSCMEQIRIFCGFKEILVYISAICSTLGRFG